MSFDWRDYVSLAEHLLNFTEEAYLRSSISRSYFGAFCIARDKRGYQDYKGKNGENIHWKVINEYRNSDNSRDQNIGRILDKLRRARNEADYDAKKIINRELAGRMVILAKNILMNIEPP